MVNWREILGKLFLAAGENKAENRVVNLPIEIWHYILKLLVLSDDPVSQQIMACVCRDFRLLLMNRKKEIYISYINQRVLAIPDKLDFWEPVHVSALAIYNCTGIGSALSLAVKKHLRGCPELYIRRHHLVLQPVVSGGRLDWFQIRRVYYRKMV